jgi:hypothetical protein
MGQYLCWGADGEDLTPIVVAKVTQEAIVATAGVAVAKAAQRSAVVQNGDRWTVLALCQQGHENVFSGSGAP